MEKKSITRYTLRAERREEGRDVHKTSSIIVQSARIIRRSTRVGENDETVLLRRRRLRRPLFVVVVAKFLLSTKSECGGGAVGGKDGDVVAKTKAGGPGDVAGSGSKKQVNGSHSIN